ncbi:MAG: glycosyltransferase family 2 protein, partial [Candidatus Micrarchaeota archaeon]|nr:glycosyltransferase family 2 protein [Candidatus Micrarchaeota archaeon]
MPKPYISVIMTAYNRKQFLNGAVDSVLIQTLDRSLYEIIIMKNFKTDYDKGWKKEGIKLLYKPDGSSGEFLYEAVKAAKGEVIAFLEDDDQFERGKLSAVYESFTKNPYLVYYYNSRKYIDAHGNDAENVNLPSNALRTKDRFIGKMDRSGMFRLLLLSSFNMSSM